MAIKKVKLPNNTVVDINDSRIPGVDTTPTSGSTNVVTSGGVQAALTNGSVTKVGTATVGASNRPIYLNAGVPTVTNPGEAFLSWGGQNLSGAFGPIDAAMVSDLGACRTSFLPASAITVEYSTDSGSTWSDYGASDSQKRALFSTSAGFTIGKNTTAGGGNASKMLRVTISPYGSLYTTLNKFVILISTSGSSGCYCTIRAKLQTNVENNVDTWATFANQVPITGWSGYNVINTSGLTAYGNSSAKSTQYGRIQFIFGCTGGSGNYTGLAVLRIMGFGGVGWTTPSNMARTGHLYAYDDAQNATFPAKVTATQFVKSGGTSSQFLKADGSVDSNTYAKTSQLPAAPGTLITNATAAQTVSSGEAMTGSITLHKVSKTGTYSDLVGKPTVDSAPTASSSNLVSSGGVYTALQNILSQIVGFDNVSTNQDGTLIITLSNGDTITVDLNHNHPQYPKYEHLASESAMPATPDADTMYLIDGGGGGCANIVYLTDESQMPASPDTNTLYVILES